jgi:hypothetical protein
MQVTPQVRSALAARNVARSSVGFIALGVAEINPQPWTFAALVAYAAGLILFAWT